MKEYTSRDTQAMCARKEIRRKKGKLRDVKARETSKQRPAEPRGSGARQKLAADVGGDWQNRAPITAPTSWPAPGNQQAWGEWRG